MPIRREFIDWCRPALAAAVDWLLSRYAADGSFDLERLIVTVPAKRAGRHLLDQLVARADTAGRVLVPPRIVTFSSLPELLYQPACPVAGSLTQQLAWIEALKGVERGRLGAVIRQLPPEDEVFGWLALAEMAASLHRELAADRLTCADVARHAVQSLSRNEAARWSLLAEVQQRYHDQLAKHGLCDLQMERLAALADGRYVCSSEIVLLGTVDLNGMQRAVLDCVAACVTAVVFAPPALAARFDEYGGVQPEAWQDLPIELPLNRIRIVEGPADQATAAAQAIAGFDGRYAADEILVGVPDARLVPFVEQRLEECGIAGRYGAGVPLSQTEPYKLLQVVAAYIESRRFKALADLLRHPAVERRLRASGVDGDCLSELDRYHGRHLPWEAGREWMPDERQPYRALPRVDKLLRKLLKPLSGMARPPAHWSRATSEFLVAMYGSAPLDMNDDAQRTIALACEEIHEALREQADVPEALAPQITAAQSLRLTLRRLSSAAVPPRRDPDAIELVGWLELPLDDAPAVIVTGFNEGIVPTSCNGDAFLPNELRRALRLEDNDRRFCRDVYTLCLLASCKKDLQIIAGRRTAENDPLIPSRLLFLCRDEELPARTLRLLAPHAHAEASRPGSLKAGAAKAEFKPPRPAPLAHPVGSMRVTEFRDYLACPYRYYLRHQLRLACSADGNEELDPGQFGTLIHDVLLHCRDDVAEATDPRDVEAFLSQKLDEKTAERFGESPLPAVRVQVEMVRARLRSFAFWQADWARQGWRVRYTEHDIPEDVASLDVDGAPMFLRGRIDRIDVNARTGQAFIFDYKTGDAARTPEQTHRAQDAWVDLQLPLYRYTSQWLDVGSKVQVGYILLPKDAKRVTALAAEWEPELFDDALETARAVVRRVRKQVFWPPVEPAPALFDEFAAICGDERLKAATLPDEDEE